VRIRGFWPLVFLLALCTGCGQVDSTARRYKAEKLFWSAQRAEEAARLKGAPDSTALLGLRDAYLKPMKEVPPPYLRGTSDKDRKAGREILHIVSNSRLQAARLAVQANRPDLALSEMDAIRNAAEGDTSLERGVDFFRLATLRQYKRTEESIALMRDMLKRYKPAPQADANNADPILELPSAIVRFRREIGDSAGARAAAVDANAYYRVLLPEHYPPAMEAQLLTNLVKIEMDQGNWNAALADLEAVRKIVAANKDLQALEPEIRYSEAKISSGLTAKKDPMAAAAMFDKVANDFPGTPAASHSLFEAGTILEQAGKKKEALDRYRLGMTKYPNDPEIAPLAFFRRAMLEDQLGNWETAKGILESIPVRFPETQGAVEAPIAIAQHYLRVKDPEAATNALQRAVTTYRSLIARDTTSSYCPVYRWSILQSYLYLRSWPNALKAVDDMVARDLGHPLGAQALLQGATVAHQEGQDLRARAYYEKFIASYPKSPILDEVKRRMAKLGKSPGA